MNRRKFISSATVLSIIAAASPFLVPLRKNDNNYVIVEIDGLVVKDGFPYFANTETLTFDEPPKEGAIIRVWRNYDTVEGFIPFDHPLNSTPSGKRKKGTVRQRQFGWIGGQRTDSYR